MNTNTPWLYIQGNHDNIPESQLGQLFNKSEKRIFNNIIFGDTIGSYGYYDDIIHHIRTIFLNTSEPCHCYNISMTQLKWLINILTNTSSEYSIVITSHLCVDKIGRWNSYPDDAKSDTFDTLRSLLEDFVSRKSGKNIATDITWDFTSSKSKLVCVFSGDSHFNNYVKRNGVNYIVRQGYGSIQSTEIAAGGTYDSFNWDEQCCFDILAIKSDGNAKVFRIGVGGVVRDLDFTY